jgi:hypothetical protein
MQATFDAPKLWFETTISILILSGFRQRVFAGHTTPTASLSKLKLE